MKAERIKVPYASLQTNERNRRRRLKEGCSERCFFCSSPIRDDVQAAYVHMTVDGCLVPANEELDEEHGSQGCFPVGPECKKRVPARFLITDLEVDE